MLGPIWGRWPPAPRRGRTVGAGTLLSQQRYLSALGRHRPRMVRCGLEARSHIGEVRTDAFAPGAVTQTDFGYTGQRDVESLGLMDYKARFYDPAMGRFTQPDTIIPGPGDPQSWNRYTYVENTPVVDTDPGGHCGVPSGAAVDPGFALDCLRDVLDAFSAYKAGDRDVLKLASRASGFTRWASETGAAVDSLKRDARTVFSNAPVSQRLPAAVNVGVFATGTAATIVGTGQVMLAGARAAAVARLQGITNLANSSLAENPALARSVLSPGEYSAGQSNAGVARLQYGNAVERIVGQNIEDSWLDRLLYNRVGGPSNPDFTGKGLLDGMNFDVTTPGQVGAHLSRAGYGEGLNVVTYTRPSSFLKFR